MWTCHSLNAIHHARFIFFPKVEALVTINSPLPN